MVLVVSRFRFRSSLWPPEAARKNSSSDSGCRASSPVRSYSSARTIITASPRCFTTRCGPSARTRRNNSLKRAFASCNCHTLTLPMLSDYIDGSNWSSRRKLSRDRRDETNSSVSSAAPRESFSSGMTRSLRPLATIDAPAFRVDRRADRERSPSVDGWRWRGGLRGHAVLSCAHIERAIDRGAFLLQRDDVRARNLRHAGDESDREDPGEASRCGGVARRGCGFPIAGRSR
jgi:hypothetical protein